MNELAWLPWRELALFFAGMLTCFFMFVVIAAMRLHKRGELFVDASRRKRGAMMGPNEKVPMSENVVAVLGTSSGEKRTIKE